RIEHVQSEIERLQANGPGSSQPRTEEMAAVVASLLSLSRRRADRLRDASPETIRRATLETIREIALLAAGERPVVVALEDLHWADEHSLDAVSLLIDTVEDAPLLLLCVHRPDPEGLCGRLERRALHRCPDRYTALRLSPLTPEQSETMVKSL